MQAASRTGKPTVVTLKVCYEKIRQMTYLENKETLKYDYRKMASSNVRYLLKKPFCHKVTVHKHQKFPS